MTNKEAIDRLNELFPYIREYQKLAREVANIEDIFQDNGGKLLQVLLVTNLQNLTDSREGNDAKDSNGIEYELKSVNIQLTKSFSTNHHLNQKIIDKYRKVDWIFAVYDDIELLEIYLMTPQMLEPYYTEWEAKYHREGKDINNPKIPLKFVRENGIRIFYHSDDYSLYPSPIEKFDRDKKNSINFVFNF
jgi:hypothetical protein